MFTNSHYVFFLIAFLSSVAFATPVKRDAANADDYIDKLLVNVRDYIKTSKMDPFTTLHHSFLNLKLTGELHGLSTLRRAGSTAMQFHSESENIQVDGVFGVSKLTANLEWSADLGLFTYKNHVKATTTDARVEISLNADLNTKKVVLSKFRVVNIGQIAIDVKTIPIPFWDRIVSLIGSGVTNLFRNQIAKLIEGPIHTFVQKALDNIGTAGLSIN